MKLLAIAAIGVILGTLLTQGALRQVEIETADNGHIAYRVCAPMKPVFDGDKWECKA